MSSATCHSVHVSLRHALLDLLAGEPMSGYDLAREFSVSLANVWPAQHSQIYPELAKLLADGLIAQTGEGPRGRKVYETTPAGLEALRSWLRDTQPDYSIRFEALLRVFCLWVLPAEEALAHLQTDRAEYVRHLAQIETAISDVDWAAGPTHRAGRLAIEFGQRFYAALIEWIDWAADQIAAGTLQPGRPLPLTTAAATPV
ncbi:MAG TPA: PadR family transcriptional regulator [Acidimicrobiales bacterium]|nr:PadR family transcriptional regulator [Acidimicrobiales bacterium]